ncbi:MAG: hypothetical protein HC906_14570 [Bacteroidales bacterium]|nr:hypothetical protein [Bacteroidales bacterium]
MAKRYSDAEKITRNVKTNGNIYLEAQTDIFKGVIQEKNMETIKLLKLITGRAFIKRKNTLNMPMNMHLMVISD